MTQRSFHIVSAGLLIAVGITLPIIFHSFAMGGPIFLPMHIPILLGGFILPPFYALAIGVITPLLSSLLTGMPVFFPQSIQMVFELAAYGFIVSVLYQRRHTSIFTSLIVGMLIGRVMAGIVNFFLLTHFLAKAFSLKVFITATLITGLPGILIQLILVPALVKLLQKSALISEENSINQN